MNDLQYTALVAHLFELAKEVGNDRNPPLTAERFLVATIDMIEAMEVGEETDDNAELHRARALIRSAFQDREQTRDGLFQYIEQNKSLSFIDDLFMKKTLREATAFSEKMGMSAINAHTIVLCLVRQPSDAIRQFLKESAIKASEHKFTVETSDETPASETSADKTEQESNDAETAREPSDTEKTAYFRSQLPPKEDTPEKIKEQIADLVCDAKRVRTSLQTCIYGQDNAINVFASGYFQASLLSLMDSRRRRPRATFLFAGPPGTGKTYLAECAAAALRMPFMRFDMSEYADKEANLEFCGSDKVYKNGKSGNVTSFVAENPRCVLLFDEIEKAHRNVIHLFLQMLDAGRLRDNYTDEEVSFSEAIIILTTNAGRRLYEESESDDLSGVSRKVVMSALQKDVNPETGVPLFPTAICSRFSSGNVVMFNRIGAHNLRTIAQREMERHAENFRKKTDIQLQIDERVYTALLFAEGGAADARAIRGRAESFFNTELYELLRLIASDKVKTKVDDIEKIRIGVDLRSADAAIGAMFAPAEKAAVLVFAEEETVALCRERVKNMDFIGASDMPTALEAMKAQTIDFVLLDMRCGAGAAATENLNAEDVESPARDFLKFLREKHGQLPVYLLEIGSTVLDEEERVSFVRNGVRGVIRLTRARNAFAKELSEIAVRLHQQASMTKLATENKVISFETAQTVSRNGKLAEIKLFDFEMHVAVDSEDAKNVLSAVSRPNVHFADVIGARDAKKELTYFVEYLKNPKKYMGTGVKAPKGILLYGPPGTGKTMLAKAMACEAGITFIAAEGNQFLKRYVGEGSEYVHELFKTARKYAPSILFIDEIDAIAKERKGGANAGANGEETLTAFLTEMDGFVSDPSRPVFVLAATNFDVDPGSEKSLDPALMRRFDRRIYIDLPGKDDRIQFLKKKIAGNSALQISDAMVENLSLRATGMSLAGLDSVAELALRSAIREGSTVVTDAILEEAFETFNSGEVKKWDVSQLTRVARHEAGHALLCVLSGETPSYLTVVARGNHGGYMQHAEQEGKAIYTRDELLARIRTSLGGRAAEIAYYGERDGISTGASGDLASATYTAQQLVCTYGMDDEFGLAVVPATATGAVAAEVRACVNRILAEQMREAIRLICANKERMDALVEALLSKNHLNAAEIERALSRQAVTSRDTITQ